MSSLLKLFILICGLLFVGTVIFLLVKRKINERNSLMWLLASIIILVLSAFPEMLEVLAHSVGVDYPPALLFLFSTLILLLVVLYQSIQISTLFEQVKELTQHVAIQGISKTSGNLNKDAVPTDHGEKKEDS